jgi:ribosomal protein L23
LKEEFLAVYFQFDVQAKMQKIHIKKTLPVLENLTVQKISPVITRPTEAPSLENRKIFAFNKGKRNAKYALKNIINIGKSKISFRYLLVKASYRLL